MKLTEKEMLKHEEKMKNKQKKNSWRCFRGEGSVDLNSMNFGVRQQKLSRMVKKRKKERAGITKIHTQKKKKRKR